MVSRYSAKLLFQFRVSQKGVSGKKRTCEERIITFQAKSRKNALVFAKNYGKKEQFDYKNSFGGVVYFEFVGITDAVELFREEDIYEVWYDIKDKLFPLRKTRFLS